MFTTRTLKIRIVSLNVPTVQTLKAVIVNVGYDVVCEVKPREAGTAASHGLGCQPSKVVAGQVEAGQLSPHQYILHCIKNFLN